MALLEHYDHKIPEYYNTMYMDGFSPEQIIQAAHRKMHLDYEERKANKRDEANDFSNLKIISEVKVQ